MPRPFGSRRAVALVVERATQCAFPDYLTGYAGVEPDWFVYHWGRDRTFYRFSAVPPEWRLFVVAGFCGGLTTFSTFSAEVVTLLRGGRVLWAFVEIGLHVTDSVLLVFAGMGTVVLLTR